MRRPAPKKQPRGKRAAPSPSPPEPEPTFDDGGNNNNDNAENEDDHDGNDDMKNTKLIPVELPPSPDHVANLPFPAQARCVKHRYEPLLWYCATCRESLCTICRIEAHGPPHETMSFDEITAPTLRRLKQLDRDVAERDRCLEQIDVPKLVDRLCSTVDSEVAFLDARLVRRCEEIKQDVRDRAARMRSDIENEMKVCQDYLRKVEECMDVLQCINVGEEPSQHPLFVPLMNGHISCSHFLRSAAPVERYSAPRIVDNLRLLELPISNTMEACRQYNWTALSQSSVPELYPRAD